MVMVPWRSGPVFPGTEKMTVPLPLPLLPEVMVIQEALLTAVHAHPLEVVTLMLPDCAA